MRLMTYGYTILVSPKIFPTGFLEEFSQHIYYMMASSQFFLYKVLEEFFPIFWMIIKTKNEDYMKHQFEQIDQGGC